MIAQKPPLPSVFISVSIAAVIWIVFGQTLHYDFVNYDDNVYVYQNPIVRSGLTFSGFAWAFTHIDAGNWHPLTTISHMIDCQLYGLNPEGHHFTNVVLHTVAAILLFAVLQQMTGTLWRSGVAAVLFAVHPLRAESVAWDIRTERCAKRTLLYVNSRCLCALCRCTKPLSLLNDADVYASRANVKIDVGDSAIRTLTSRSLAVKTCRGPSHLPAVSLCSLREVYSTAYQVPSIALHRLLSVRIALATLPSLPRDSLAANLFPH